MSATTFAGSGQVAAVSVLGAGGGIVAAVAAALLLNARYVPIGITVAGAFDGGVLRRFFESQLVVDESWALHPDHRCDGRRPTRVEALVSTGWVVVLVTGIGSVLLKAVGPVGVAGRRLPLKVSDLLALVAPAILAALVVTETFASGRSLVVDARLAGLLAGVAAVALRLPIWAVVVAGGVATALVRLVT